MKISELQRNCLISDSDINEFKNCHPKQIINKEIPIPIWKINYSYNTIRNNQKIAIKYLILKEDGWDLVENEFNNYIEVQNEKYPERKLSNVEILDTKFLGYIYLPLE